MYVGVATALLSLTINGSNPMAYLNFKRLQNPLELGWIWMLDFNIPIPKPKSNQNLRQVKALDQFESEVEARRDYYQVGGRW